MRPMYMKVRKKIAYQLRSTASTDLYRWLIILSYKALSTEALGWRVGVLHNDSRPCVSGPGSEISRGRGQQSEIL